MQPIFLRLEDLKDLVAQNGWLSSDLISCYLKVVLNSPNIQMNPDICVLDCYFIQRFPRPKGFELSSRVMNSHILGTNNFETSKKILLPVNVNNRHWIAVQIDRNVNLIQVFDSNNPQASKLNYKNESLESKILSFLTCKVPGTQFDSKRFTFKYEDSIYQPDGSSCGIYAILIILQKLNLLNFRIENSVTFIRNIRLAIFHEILTTNSADLRSNQNGFILNIL